MACGTFKAAVDMYIVQLQGPTGVGLSKSNICLT